MDTIKVRQVETHDRQGAPDDKPDVIVLAMENKPDVIGMSYKLVKHLREVADEMDKVREVADEMDKVRTEVIWVSEDGTDLAELMRAAAREIEHKAAEAGYKDYGASSHAVPTD